MATSGMVFGIPLSFLSLISGIVLGLRGRWGVLRYRWTAIKLGLNVAVIACGALLATATVVSVFKPGGRLRRAQTRQAFA